MRNLLLLLAVIFLLSPVCRSQIPESFPSVDKNDLPDAKISSERIFTGESLFGYIDGGAELYLEYGFVSAHISEINIMGGRYKTEIYRMEGPEEAFGIFSVSRFRCRSMPPVSVFCCQTRFQLMICSGSYYVSIINGSGNESDSIASLKIGEQIVRKIKEQSADLSVYLPGVARDTIRKHAILVKGRLGIMNGIPDLEDFFRNASRYTAVILPDNERTLLTIKFKSEEDLLAFTSLHKWNPENISAFPGTFTEGFTVNKLSDNTLLIKIPK
jgi:hypothetical protein